MAGPLSYSEPIGGLVGILAAGAGCGKKTVEFGQAAAAATLVVELEPAHEGGAAELHTDGLAPDVGLGERLADAGVHG
ncbi:MAG: hypothetical protein F4Y94_09995 [Chloroflexi bacterium]|nr:hypothetical protein [Chloroflexota bacterium]